MLFLFMLRIVALVLLRLGVGSHGRKHTSERPADHGRKTPLTRSHSRQCVRAVSAVAVLLPSAVWMGPPL